jgi:hypothetical protein
MKEQLEECHTLGYLTEEFAVIAMSIASKQINRRKAIPYSVREEAISSFSLKLVRKWHLIKIDGYPQSYINMMASSTLIDIQRKFKRDLDKGGAIEEKRKIEESFLFVAPPPQMDYRTLTVVEKASIKRGLIRLMGSGVSQMEIHRTIHIPRMTLYRWQRDHKRYGDHFFRKDDRSKE